MPLILGANSVSGYTVKNSLRFNSGSSDNLTRTPASTTNRRTFTLSFWLKRTSLASGNKCPFAIGNSAVSIADADWFILMLHGSTNTLRLVQYNNTIFATNRVFRDIGAWYHIVVAVDTTQATASNRVKLYINGTQETSYSSSADPSLNYQFNVNTTTQHMIGREDGNGSAYFDGYLSDYYFIDGQQLTPSSFGETDTDTGIWKPKAYTGSFGTNGFYLEFKNSASLGTDTSGNGNNFTVNNLTSIDQTTDTPTNNFCTLNPLNTGTGTLSEGNLKWVTSSSTGYLTFGTIAIDMNLSNKFYCEMKLNTSGGIVLGIAPTTLRGSDTGRAGSYGYYNNGDKYSGTTASSYGASFTTNDIIGMLAGNGTLTFYKNGVSQGTAFSGLTGTYIPFLAEVSCDVSMNFGNPPFTISSSETDPSGFGNFEYSTNSGYALNTKNLANFG